MMKWGLRSTLCLAAASVAGASVIGIDFGSTFMKVALVQLKVPLEIVPNTISKRKTEIAVAFDRGERMFGSDAVGMLSRKPGMAFAHFREMMGRQESHPLAAAVKELKLGTEAQLNATRGGLEYRYKADENLASFSAEELAAMVFTYAQDITKDFGGQVVRDCVITVPAFATSMERRAIITAAEIAGLKVLSLIEDNTAAALHYGKDNVFEDKVVLYYNMGAGSTQVTIVKYGNFTVKEMGKNKTVGTFEVLGKAWDPTLGGEQIDKALMEHTAAAFAKKSGSQEVFESKKALAKLRAQATKTKTVLSANNGVQVKVNSVLGENDYAEDMSRAQLETLIRPLLDRTTTPIQQALDFANLTLGDVHAVEMLGGGQRVPGVQAALQAFFGEGTELGVHLNADEATALGAAFAAANISTQFKVRKTGMVDHSPWAVDVKLASKPPGEEGGGAGGSLLGGLFGGGGSGKKLSKEDAAAAEAEAAAWKKSATVFQPWTRLETSKKIAFHHDRDIVCGLSYSPAQATPLPEGTPAFVAAYNVTGVGAFAASLGDQGVAGCGPDLNPKPKVTLHFKLDASGMVVLSKAEATCEQPPKPDEGEEGGADAGDMTADAEDEEAKDEEAKDEEAKDEAAASAVEGEDTAAEGDKKEKEEEKELTEEEKAAAKEEEKARKKAEKKAKKEKEAAARKAKKEKAKKEKPIKADLEVVEDFSAPEVRALSPAEAAASQEKLAYLKAKDDIRRAKLEAKNGLESYLYATKNRVEDEAETVDQVSTEEQREALVALCRETLDWLDEDGFDVAAEKYGSKRVDVEDLAEPLFFRATELGARPAAVAAAEKRLKDIKLLMAKWETTMPQVTEAERDSVVALVDKAKAWLDEKVAAQEAATLVEAPKFTAAEVEAQLKPTASLVTKLSRKPKPKPKPEVVVSNATNATNATEGATEGGTEGAADADAATEAADASGGASASDEKKEGGDAESSGPDDDEL